MKKKLMNYLMLPFFALVFTSSAYSSPVPYSIKSEHDFDISKYYLENVLQSNMFQCEGVEGITSTTEQNADGYTIKTYKYNDIPCGLSTYNKDGKLVSDIRYFGDSSTLSVYYFTSGSIRRIEFCYTPLRIVHAVSYSPHGIEEARIFGYDGDLLYRDENGVILKRMYKDPKYGVYWEKLYDPKTGIITEEYALNFYVFHGRRFIYDSKGNAIREETWHEGEKVSSRDIPPAS